MRARSVGAEIREGLAEIWHNSTLRALAWSIAVWQVFRHAYFAIVVLFAARELGFSPGHLGVLWMLAGLGTLASAGAVEPLNRRLGFGPTMLLGILGTGVAWLIVADASGGPIVATAILVVMLALIGFRGLVLLYYT